MTKIERERVLASVGLSLETCEVIVGRNQPLPVGIAAVPFVMRDSIENAELPSVIPSEPMP